MVRLLTREITHRPRRGTGNELILVFDAEHLSRVARENSRDVA
jgi:hypothetical protein